MRKVTKIFVKVLSAVVLLLIILPLLVSLLISIPSIQNYLVDKTAAFASEKIGTRVSVGHISIGFLYKVKVRDFYVEDYDGDTLLYAGSLSARLAHLHGMGKKLHFAAADLDNAVFNLRETERGVMNIKEIIDSIGRKKGKGGFELVIDDLTAEHLDFTLSRQYRRPNLTPSDVDYSNMQLFHIDTRIAGFYVRGGAVGGNIERLAFKERSGFDLKDMNGEFYVNAGVIKLDKMQIRTAQSDVHLDSFSLRGDGWASYKDFVHNVPIEARVLGSTVSSSDVGCFAPSMRAWQTSISNLTCTMSGVVSNFTAEVVNSHIEGGGVLRAEAVCRNLPDTERAEFNIRVQYLRSKPQQLFSLAERVARLKLPDNAVQVVERCGEIVAKAAFRGGLNDFTASGNMRTARAGAIEFDGTMRGSDRQVTAKINSEDANIGVVTGNKLFGTTAFAATADGTLGGDTVRLSVTVDVSHAVVNAAVYGGVSARARINGSAIDAFVNATDPKCIMDMHAVLDVNAEKPSYDVVLNIDRADLHAMRINRRDSVSVLSAAVGVQAVGKLPDDVKGEISVADAVYRQNDKTVSSERMVVTLDSNEDMRSVMLNSDFADAVLESRSSYNDVVVYAENILYDYLPLLSGNGERKREHVPNTQLTKPTDAKDIGEFAMLSVTAKEINPVLDCIAGGLEVAQGSTVRAFFVPSRNMFLMHAKSDYIERNQYLATELKMNLSNRSDSLSMTVRAADFYMGTMHIPALHINGGAKHNNISLRGSFADSLNAFNGELSADASIRRNPLNGVRSVDVRILPSFVRSRTKMWSVTSGPVTLDSSRVVVDNFNVRCANQRLSIDGVASRQRSDSLTLTLQGFDLAPFLQVTRSMGYEISGRTSGYASIKSALRDSELTAHIAADSVQVNGVAAPDMTLDSSWDFSLNRAKFTVSAKGMSKPVIRGFYDPNKVRYYANMRVDSLNMGLLDPMLKGTITQTRGRADVDLSISGERRKADLNGTVTVRDLSTEVAYTKCRYMAPKAVVEVKNNVFKTAEVPITDSEGHKGRMWFDLSLDHLSNIAYELRVSMDNMLALNTTQRDNDQFYGKVYASGGASIKGDKMGVVMRIAAETEDNSVFFMPLSGKSSISNADFVVFAKPNTVDTTNFMVRKKMMFERRQRKASAAGGNMDINMEITARPNAEVQLVIDPTVGDVIKGRGEGVLNLHINPRMNVFEMVGDYTITQGSYLFTLQNIVNKWFVIDSGSTIQWTGEPLDAILNIDAVYKLKASLQPLLQGSVDSNVSTRAVPVECIIHLTDRLTKPTVTFDVVVPNADSEVQSVITNVLSSQESIAQQFLYLMIANSFMSETSSSSSNIGVSATSATGFELLSNQLSNWLSTDDYNIVLRYRPKTEQMSDEIDFGFSKGLIGNRLLIEAEGNYVVDNAQMINSTGSNFMGEAYVTWLIDKAGTLKLKGFTHTIDRFDENQGLQETGIGIYFKEDFENPRDLWHRLVSRFSSKKSKARRAARQQARASAAAATVTDNAKQKTED